ncbi:hypothetical protein, partial [Sandarakinorhabdus sp.]|uniref:hypothetical protein n=1 Tax=Sandarakinorhabdus sp. TaxID=1916663 RepID=UPI0033407CD5
MLYSNAKSRERAMSRLSALLLTSMLASAATSVTAAPTDPLAQTSAGIYLLDVQLKAPPLPADCGWPCTTNPSSGASTDPTASPPNCNVGIVTNSTPEVNTTSTVNVTDAANGSSITTTTTVSNRTQTTTTNFTATDEGSEQLFGQNVSTFYTASADATVTVNQTKTDTSVVEVIGPLNGNQTFNTTSTPGNYTDVANTTVANVTNVTLSGSANTQITGMLSAGVQSQDNGKGDGTATLNAGIGAVTTEGTVYLAVTGTAKFNTTTNATDVSVNSLSGTALTTQGLLVGSASIHGDANNTTAAYSATIVSDFGVRVANGTIGEGGFSEQSTTVGSGFVDTAVVTGNGDGNALVLLGGGGKSDVVKTSNAPTIVTIDSAGMTVSNGSGDTFQVDSDGNGTLAGTLTVAGGTVVIGSTTTNGISNAGDIATTTLNVTGATTTNGVTNT